MTNRVYTSHNSSLNSSYLDTLGLHKWYTTMEESSSLVGKSKDYPDSLLVFKKFHLQRRIHNQTQQLKDYTSRPRETSWEWCCASTHSNSWQCTSNLCALIAIRSKPHHVNISRSPSISTLYDNECSTDSQSIQYSTEKTTSDRCKFMKNKYRAHSKHWRQSDGWREWSNQARCKEERDIYNSKSIHIWNCQASNFTPFTGDL